MILDTPPSPAGCPGDNPSRVLGVNLSSVWNKFRSSHDVLPCGSYGWFYKASSEVSSWMSLMGTLVGETVKGHCDGSNSVPTSGPTHDLVQGGCQAKYQAAAPNLQAKVKQPDNKTDSLR